MSVLFRITVIILLLILTAFFSLAEFAIVSAKPARLKIRADNGSKGAANALILAEDPAPFLSMVQIVTTLITILFGAFAAITLSSTISDLIREYAANIPYLIEWITEISFAAAIIIITFIVLVFGNLIPKRIALSSPEKTASSVAGIMTLITKIASPFTFILTWVTDIFMRIFGFRRSAEEPVTEEEIKLMIEKGTDTGTIEKSELEMVENIFDMDNERISTVMIPRPDIVAINLDSPANEIMETITSQQRSIFPVYKDDLDNIVGIIHIKDLWLTSCDLTPKSIEKILRKPLCVPKTLTISQLLEEFKKTRNHFALISDEYGSIAGLVTLHDILESIVGDIQLEDEPPEVGAFKLDDGTWLVDGDMLVDNFKEALGISELPSEDTGIYLTVAGFILMEVQKIPKTGDKFRWKDLIFEVSAMDGNRIDKVRVTEIPSAPEPEDGKTDTI